jgi:hypothetical protein
MPAIIAGNHMLFCQKAVKISGAQWPSAQPLALQPHDWSAASDRAGVQCYADVSFPTRRRSQALSNPPTGLETVNLT